MTTTSDHSLPRALFVIRWSIVLFLLPWTIEKFTQPELTARIFAKFYFINDLPEIMSFAVGVFWLILLILFAFGVKRTFSYGLVMILHGIGTLTTWQQLLPFLDTHNHLFLAAIPTLGAMIALFLLREHDTVGTVG